MARQISRRRFTRLMLVSGTAISCALPARWAAGAADFTFKWGTNVPETHPLNVHARKAAEAIKQETNGRLEVQLFPTISLAVTATCSLSYGRERWSVFRFPA
jgi:TRAP-type C4-dicarboxylate transport system substrate-binding protein